MMKTKLLLLLFLFAFKLSAFAQNKITKYCGVSILNFFGENNVRPRIDIGKVDSLLSIKDTNVKSQLLKINSLKTTPDVLNYMTSIGWTFLSSAPSYFIFKRDFDPSELNSTKTQ